MFTQEEVTWLANVFRTPELRPNPLDPKAVETTLRIQSIIKKMTELQEKTDEFGKSESGATSNADQHEQPNGNREAKAAR